MALLSTAEVPLLAEFDWAEGSRSGRVSRQGRARAVMECWYTSADREPGAMQ